MSLKFIHDFQLSLHSLLSQDDRIQATVDKIYLSVVRDAKYPFILINLLKLEDCSQFDQMMYNVHFEVGVFTRDKSRNVAILLAERITSKLNISDYKFNNYMIVGMKSISLNFEHSQDLLTTKLTIDYKALLTLVLL